MTCRPGWAPLRRGDFILMSCSGRPPHPNPLPRGGEGSARLRGAGRVERVGALGPRMLGQWRGQAPLGHPSFARVLPRPVAARARQGVAPGLAPAPVGCYLTRLSPGLSRLDAERDG